MSAYKGLAQQIRQAVADPRFESEGGFNAILRFFAKWRAQVLAEEIFRRHGGVVLGGPFAGMQFVGHGEGGVAPRLLGCYEPELRPHIERFIADGFETVLNIGCATGYYAVGMALRMPSTKVHAYDIDVAARETCRAVAERNGVEERFEVGGEFRGEDFAQFRGRTLLLCDIEGAEDALLRPDAYPALKDMHVVVECHDGLPSCSGIQQRLIERFSATHRITRVQHSLGAVELPDWLSQRGHIDQLLAIWEWRAIPTPWLIMRPKFSHL